MKQPQRQYLRFTKIMAVARKSAVSTKSSWFRRDSSLPSEQRRSESLGKPMQSTSTLASESTAVRSRRRGNPSRNLSFSPIKEAVKQNLVKDSGKQAVANIPEKSSGRLPMMSTARAVPVWLLRLYTVYRYSSAAAFLFVSATLVVYGWTVYSQELWSQAYRTLQSLQRNERQLNTTNATLTSKMAEEGEQPAAGLVSPNPGGTIFLPPTSHNPNSASSNTIASSEEQPQAPTPLGY
ncbi:conserved hypothetical protein ['Nostoc azollae' 0708]|jgi:hypothetical protein|uniref:Cell division protein FtsL n=2 Tax=Trichormus azollae TaxID=1164 RepID=D7E4Y3_NOSA0|nr:conserved hypothetical protein ['Nostoc azollae' 0708]